MTATKTKPRSITLPFEWNDAIETLFGVWHRDVTRSELAHRVAADRERKRRVLLDVLAFLTTTVIAVGAFASISDAGSSFRAAAGVDLEGVMIIVGSIGVLAAVLTSLQMFARFATRAERHRVASVRYASLGREIEAMLAIPRDARTPPDDALNDVRRRMDRYAKESPAIPKRLRSRWEEDQPEVHRRPSAS